MKALAFGTAAIALAALNVVQFVLKPAPAPAVTARCPPAPTLPACGTPEQLSDDYHVLFYDRLSAWGSGTWLGVETLQNPNDVWITQEIIQEVKPDLIVELGTYRGGSAALWATILAQVNPTGRVLSVDIEDRAEGARKLPIVQRSVDFIVGSSTSPAVIADILKRTEGKRTLFIFDSNHVRDHVLAELVAYTPMVSKGSYAIVQDTNLNGHPVNRKYGPGPMEAVDSFLAGSTEFEPDRGRERVMLSFHPKGYLKRRN
jgi:cephalosporin hydroxylase